MLYFIINKQSKQYGKQITLISKLDEWCGVGNWS